MAPTKVNGTTKSDPMIIDLDDDDDEPAATAEPNSAPAEFEQDEDEVDPSAPYRDILRYIDIPLGTAACRVAVPHIGNDLAQAAPGSWPAIYSNRIVVAVACTDLTISVISAPPHPPTPELHDISKMDIQVVKIEGANSHQQFVSDIAITHTGLATNEQEEVEVQTEAKPHTRSQVRSKQENAEVESVQWSLLIASISCTGPGLLLVHQIPLHDNQISSSAEHLTPLRRTYLRSSSMSARLSFNPSPYPAERHSTLLITLPSDSTTKVYQIFQTHTRERRGSTATTDSTSTTRSTRHFGTERGRFLMTFLPSLSQEASDVGQRRKRVLDAQWIAGGRAVIALLEDGEWGIWDFEAVGPTSSSSGTNLVRGQGNISGIQGGSLTKFAARSNIAPIVETRPTSSASQTQPTSGSLAPMTPSTRKVRSEGLFQGSKLNNDTAKPSTQQYGAIFVAEKPSNRTSHDESVIVSYGDENAYLPSILSFWKGETKPMRLPSVKLAGQIPRSISLLPSSSSADSLFSATSIFDTTASKPDFLIQTSHRLILSLNALSSRPGSADASTQTALAPSDQTLLDSGDLDVEGMDRLLDGMGDDPGTKKPMNLFNKSVGFRIHDEGDDEDIDMTGSPTPSQARGLRIPNGRSGLGGATPVPKRRIFT